MIDWLLDWLQRRRQEKCREEGHDGQVQVREGYKGADWDDRRAVAYDVTEQRRVCSRCGEVLSEWEETRRKAVQGLTLPGDMGRKLDDDGVVWVRRQNNL